MITFIQNILLTKESIILESSTLYVSWSYILCWKTWHDTEQKPTILYLKIKTKLKTFSRTNFLQKSNFVLLPVVVTIFAGIHKPQKNVILRFNSKTSQIMTIRILCLGFLTCFLFKNFWKSSVQIWQPFPGVCAILYCLKGLNNNYTYSYLWIKR